jgi:hypothetical protein
MSNTKERHADLPQQNAVQLQAQVAELRAQVEELTGVCKMQEVALDLKGYTKPGRGCLSLSRVCAVCGLPDDPLPKFDPEDF